MIRVLSLTVMAGVLTMGLSAGSASAQERDRDRDRGRMREVCTWVTKCHTHDFKRICEREKVCKMVRRDHD